MTTRPGQGMIPRAAAPGTPPWPGEQNYRGEWADRVPRRPYDSEPEPEWEPEAEFAPEPMHFPEEDVFARMIDRSPKRPPLRRWAPALIGSVAALAVTAAAFLYFRDDPAPQPTASNSPAPAAEPVVPASRCPAERVGNKIQGNGDGGTDSGPGAIFAFQYAYYVTRSAEQVRAVVAPNASVPTVNDIQHGIDSIPAGTTHCVAITPGAFAGQYRVVITENRPGRDPMTYNAQLVSVARTGDRTLITSIAAAG
ncbi:hypothetical protein [Nocardia lijiangensis]|uniref:hypothetical protein n=1 Tax=Nocardia lijiangensis TaxID=299618 RepID=UPI0012DC7D5D|nr:hypothetical protein [Nocardia lijiangensis]